MSKQQLLTERDVERYQLNPEFVRYLDAFRRLHGLERAAVRVLDFGCGRGEAVVKLRRLGYPAQGADIDPSALENGRAYLRTGAGDPDWLLPIGDDGRVDAADGSFQFVFSETVLEHVRDLDVAAREMARLMATPSAALHAFPARRHIVEQHLRMPCVHWLPKNGLRTAAIFLCVLVGMEPRWEPEGLRARVRRYSRYSKQNTFYRRPRDLERTFAQHGFRVDFVSIDHPKVAQHPLGSRLLRTRAGRAVVEALILNFKTVELWLRKPATVRPESTPTASA